MPTTEAPKLTTRELLDAVNGAEVWQEPDGTSNLYLRYVFGMSDPYRDVTAEIGAAERAGLVRVVDTPGQSGLWWLTKRGARVVQGRRFARLLARLGL